MKYIVLIHANPIPWGHPTAHFTDEGRQVPAEEHARMDADFDALLAEISASGEFVTAEALGDPAASTLFTWADGDAIATDGPYAEVKEQLAGYFVIDCATRRRAEQVAARFAQPGGTIELRPLGEA